MNRLALKKRCFPFDLSVFVAALALLASTAKADVRLPALICDHMMLQQKTEANLWGWAYAGETVEIEASWGEKVKAVASSNGVWSVKIKTPAAQPLDKGLHPETITFRVSTENAVQVKDVLIGEVWLCSGQSNMAMMLGPDAPAGRNNWYGEAFWNEESAKPDRPALRLINIEKSASLVRQPDCKSLMPDHSTPVPEANGLFPDTMYGWQACTKKTLPWFSAVAYYFGVKLQEKLNVPVGLITSTVGGTAIQCWISLDALRSLPGKADVATELANPFKKAPSVLFNSMIAPLTPMTIQGVIWYQGESNANDSGAYQQLLSTLISDWRTQWKNPALPFYIVQLANFGKVTEQPVGHTWANIREAQLNVARTVTNTGLAVAIDLGDTSIHPKNKRDVGQRLALIALARDYGKELEYSGPSYESMCIEGRSIRLKFSHQGGGLVAKNGQLKQFAIAGADKKFVWADAVIDSETIVVSGPNIEAPVAVRYAWAANPEGCNLYNKAGLPASPFRTDEW